LDTAIIVYHSLFGNNKQIAMSLARGLEEAGITVDSLPLEEIQLDDLEKYDLVAIGGPTHVHRPSKAMREFLKKLRKIDLSDSYAIVWGTYIRHIFSGDSSKRIAKALRRTGAKVLSRLSVNVEGREGPLEHQANAKFRDLGIQMAGLPKLSDVPLSPSKWSQMSFGIKGLWFFFQIFYWAFMISAVVGGMGAGIWTLIPTAWLGHGASKPCYLGYVAHCSFTPWSSIILFALVPFGIWGILRGLRMVRTTFSKRREIPRVSIEVAEIPVRTA
jgi:flavodoxin